MSTTVHSERANPLLESLRLCGDHLWVVEGVSEHRHPLRCREQMHREAAPFSAFADLFELPLHLRKSFCHLEIAPLADLAVSIFLPETTPRRG